MQPKKEILPLLTDLFYFFLIKHNRSAIIMNDS